MEHTRSAPPRPWRSLARAKAANLAMLVAALATALHLSASALDVPSAATEGLDEKPALKTRSAPAETVVPLTVRTLHVPS